MSSIKLADVSVTALIKHYRQFGGAVLEELLADLGDKPYRPSKRVELIFSPNEILPHHLEMVRRGNAEVGK